MTYNIIDIDLSIPRIDEVYNLSGDSIKVINATSDCFIQFDDTSQDPINLLLVDEIKVKFTKFYLSNVGIENKSIKIVVSDNFNLDNRISITDYIKNSIPEPIPEPIPDPTPTPTPFLPGFGFRIPITIPHTKVVANEVNCPIYVRLRQNNFDFTKARNDGLDVCFTQDDGQTLLDFERDRHDNINLKGDYMVKIPNISSVNDTKFFMYYGNPSATDISNPTAVWDINYVARWSLKEDPAGLAPQMKDSTINANHGTTHGGMTSMQSMEGKIDKALNFDGVDDYINIPYNFGPPTFLTISLWFKTTTTMQGILFDQNNRQPPNTPTSHVPSILIRNDGKIRAEFWNGSVGEIITTSSYNNGIWHHVILKGGGNLQELFVNGISIGTRIGEINLTWWLYSVIGIGWGSISRGFPSDGWKYFNGSIDEIRISNIARSDSWINLQYQTQKDTLLTFGPEESA